MPDNTLTLYLDGDVSLSEFAETIRHFSSLVDLLSRELASDSKINWVVDDLQAGSALASVVGVSSDEGAVLRVVEAYENVGRSLQRHEPIPFPESIAREAVAITKVLGDKIVSVSFQTASEASVVYGDYDIEKQVASGALLSFGAVKGKVQTLSSRGKLKFTLYDPLFDKPVTCYVKEGTLQNRLKEIWGQNVTVYGRVAREPEHGRALSVRDITRIEDDVNMQSGSYKAARGAFNWSEGDEPAEVTVRRIRDAE